jgi:hypothetical protein
MAEMEIACYPLVDLLTLKAYARRAAAFPEVQAAIAEAQAAYAHARAYQQAMAYAHIRAYVSLAVNGSGLLAVFLSSVILLGGFIESLDKLGRMDFWCVTAITVIQAAGSVTSPIFFYPCSLQVLRNSFIVYTVPLFTNHNQNWQSCTIDLASFRNPA